MSFSSLTFLYFFLPITLFGYYILPAKKRNIFLLLSNIIFYGWGEPSFLIVILFTTVINFYCAKFMTKYKKHKKHIAIFAIFIDLLILFVFKYLNFLFNILNIFGLNLKAASIGLPLGISFYTFQVVSYIIDIYREDIYVENNFTNFYTYMTFFPQLIAGPIVRFSDLAHQLKSRNQNIDLFASGICKLFIGLGKKVLIANNMGLFWETLKQNPMSNGVVGSWLGALAYTLHIYFDFSGYSDMACGLGKMFGFELPINFNYPYISKSITEFWHRWHISLSTWFRDYVYIPLGGNRGSKYKTICNLLIVWILTGLWHGANFNFVIWGFYYFCLLVLEKIFILKKLENCKSFIKHIYTMTFVMIGWIIFAFDDLNKLKVYFKSMFFSESFLISNDIFIISLNYLPIFIISIFAALPYGKKWFEKIKNKKISGFLKNIAVIICIFLCTAALVSQSYNPFLYFRF